MQQVAIQEDHSLAIVEEKIETQQIATKTERPEPIDELTEKTIQEPKAPTKTSSRHSKPLHRKPVKKPTLAELDTKLKQILEGEIEL